MKKCPVDNNCIGFDSIDEFKGAFREIAKASGEEFDDALCIEGNSGLSYADVERWVSCFGVENVYFEDNFSLGDITEFYFDLKNAKYNGNVDFSKADEMSIRNGFLRIWFD